MECRLVGGFKAKQGKSKGKMEENNRFIAVPVASTIFKQLTDWEEVPVSIVRELEDFFINYNKEEGKLFKAKGYLGVDQALNIINRQTA
nr:inorganic diphosphatase [Taibaiella koreensis]